MSATAAEHARFPFDEDSILVGRVLSGDASAFDSIYARYYDKVYAIAKGVLLDPEEAADAAQDAFTLVFRNLHRFNSRSKLGTWIFRIAVNSAIQRGRRLKHRTALRPLSEAANQADNLSLENETWEAVAKALDKLRPEDRAVLTLFYWEDLSLDEIGEALGCGANAAKTRLYRARERFRAVYEEADAGGS